MSKNVIRVTPVGGFDIPELENWLAAMSKKGLRFSMTTGILTIFERTEQRIVQIHLEPIRGTAEDDPELNALYEDAGWQYWGIFRGSFYVFASDDLTAQAYTDIETHEYALKRFFKEKAIGGVLLVVANVLLLGLYQNGAPWKIGWTWLKYFPNPKLAFRIREIETLRQAILEEKYSAENRALEVTYLYGASGTGKTRGIFETHDRKSICRITDYGGRNGVRFDAYHCQDVLVLEEFHSQIPISAMLNYLDIYPLTLPARYTDRIACYTKVYITSNIPLEEQYRDIQRYQMETWRAFLRRVQNVIEYLPDGSTVQHKKGGIPYDPK